jgi:hypothetical protein
MRGMQGEGQLTYNYQKGLMATKTSQFQTANYMYTVQYSESAQKNKKINTEQYFYVAFYW